MYSQVFLCNFVRPPSHTIHNLLKKQTKGRDIDILKIGEDVSMRLLGYYNSMTAEKGCEGYITFFCLFVERPHNLYIQIM